ncbi:hypothetical protein BS78_03G168100 [Paspalum vaginatum]|nr:hypothetical protein BS78_03G168100 [Paspalum vaginatum]
MDAHISAPKLAEVNWDGDTAYDPRCHCFLEAGRHLRQLPVGSKCLVASLMQRFDKVDVLKLRLDLCDLTGTAEGFNSFMDQTIRLPNCDALRLRVSLVDHHHNFTSTILHLLRRCDSTRKVSVKSYPCPLSCLCRLPESCKADGITLDSLEEVKITFITSSYKGMELLEQLARCHAPSLKRSVINCELFRDGPETKELEEVCRMFCPDIIVKFNVI